MVVVVSSKCLGLGVSCSRLQLVQSRQKSLKSRCVVRLGDELWLVQLCLPGKTGVDVSVVNKTREIIPSINTTERTFALLAKTDLYQEELLDTTGCP